MTDLDRVRAVLDAVDVMAPDSVRRQRDRLARNLLPAALDVVEAARYRPTRDGSPIEFPHLSQPPSGPDLLVAIAAYMDRQDDAAEARGEVVSREVQADLLRWAVDLRAALDAYDAKVQETL